VALRQVDDRRLVEPFAGGTSVEQLLDDPDEGTIAVGEPQTDARSGDEQPITARTWAISHRWYGKILSDGWLSVTLRSCPGP
jgi:hypothetical protein